MLQLIKAIIFDLDGVIVDTAKYHFLAWKRLANELGIPFTEADNERLKGVSRMHSLEIILEIGKVTLSTLEKEQLANRKNTWFMDYVERMSFEEIYPGVRQLLKEIRAKKIKVGLASSSKNAKSVLQLLQIEKDFDTVVDGNMIIHSKPDPEIFLLAATRLQIDPSSCLVFEDAEAGVDAALSAGMKCIGVGSPVNVGKAHLVIEKTGDFTFDHLSKLAMG